MVGRAEKIETGLNSEDEVGFRARVCKPNEAIIKKIYRKLNTRIRLNSCPGLFHLTGAVDMGYSKDAFRV